MGIVTPFAPGREREKLVFMIKGRLFIKGMKGIDPRVLDKVFFDPEGIRILTGLSWGIVEGLELDAVGCFEETLLPLVGTLVLTSRYLKRPLKGLLIGKRGIKGDMVRRDKVLLLSSIVGDGKAILEFGKTVEKNRGKIVKVLCVLDDEENTPERREVEDRYGVISLIKLSDLKEF